MGDWLHFSDSVFNNAVVQDSRNEIPVVSIGQLIVMCSWPKIILDIGGGGGGGEKIKIIM